MAVTIPFQPDPTRRNADTQAIKRSVNILTLVSGLRREASTQGGEYSGPCPKCGGTDRFHAQPHRSEGGRWMCRQCTPDKWGDVIALVMWLDGVDFKEAVRRLGGPRQAPALLRPAAPKPAPKVERGPVVATYDYTDESGDLLFQVRRYEPKAFTQHRPDGHGGWVDTLGEVRRVLYNTAKLSTADPREPVWLVEGEKDVHTLTEAGLLATTNPGGTGMGWRAEYTAQLEGRRVILVPDQDKAGQDHAAKVQAALLGHAAPLRILLLDAKDVTEWFAAGHTREELITLAKDAPDATPPPHVSPYRLLTRDQVANLPPPEWLVTDLLETNTVSMLYGQTGIGKTFVTLDLALAVATGQPWWGQPVKAGAVLYILGEGMSGLNARLMAWEHTRQLAATNIHFVVEPVNLMGATVAQDLAACLPTPPALIVFDTLARCIGAGDENDNTDMNQMVNTITALKEATGATILLIHHPGKTDTGPRGASCIPNACDTILKLTGSSELLKLQGEKQRNGPTDNPWQFALDVVEVGTRVDSDQPLTSCVVTLASNARSSTTLTPNQRTMLTVLNGRTLDPATAQELVDATNLSKSVVYRELETLAERDLIAPEQQGRSRRYTITNAGRDLLTHSHHSLGMSGNDAETGRHSLPFPHPYSVGMGKKDGPGNPCTDCGDTNWFTTPTGAQRCKTCGQVEVVE